MRRILAKVGVVLALAIVEFAMGSSLTLATTPRRAHRLAHRLHHATAHAQASRHRMPQVPYGNDAGPTPTCRYADGTPYDPDIIGGPNHVGDGGPAANFGGFDPCGD